MNDINKFTKEELIAKAIDDAVKEYTTVQIARQLRQRYTDSYIREEILPYCIKGVRLALLEIIR